MNEYSFIIDGWTWSFSRVNYECLYELKLNYIDGESKSSSAYSQFGAFCHKILEMYAKGEIEYYELSSYYEDHFDEEVTLDFPPNKYTDLREKAFYSGLEYFENIDLNLNDYEILGVEKEVRFEIGGYNFVGYIDLLLRNPNTGEITILDHKSSSIKILKNGKVSKSDQWHFEQFKKQLLLYSIPVLEEYGRVDYLKWNMFKDHKTIQIPFSRLELDKAKEWALAKIREVENETEWSKHPSYFYCNNLCSMREHCDKGVTDESDSY